MDFFFLLQLAKAAVREFWTHRYVTLFTGFFLAIGILGYGMLWQEKYSVSSTLYADQQNIIAPLLKGQAQVTEVEDQLQIVEDLMLSQTILEKIVTEAGFLDDNNNDSSRQAAIANSLRGSIRVKSLGKNYIGVSYVDGDPDRAYNLITQLVDLFLEESSENKRSESKQAFLFIDKQVNSYKEQLRLAEEKLKQFNASNLDGTEAHVQGKIESLRSEISELELDLEQSNERVVSLKKEISEEDRYLSKKARSEEFRERITAATAKLDDLLLTFTDNHPDVIAMRQHIDALRESANISKSNESGGVTSLNNENPVYDELRSSLAAAQVETNTVRKRKNSLQARLVEERGRARRIAERDAELAELTRDYDVTKGLYEDLLERKEQARLSMSLDIEGQGVTYKIQQPAKYPLSPSGLRFIHFVFIGCAVGLIIPLGLIVAYIFLDPRIRFSNTIEQEFDIPLLGEIPHLISNPVERMRKSDFRWFIMVVLSCAVIYCVAGVFASLWS